MRTVDAAGLPIGDGHPPRIMGVLNVSRESPYGPSVFADPEAAARYVDEALVGEGADIVDVGLESANKRFEVLSPAAERDRLEVAFETLDRVEGDAVFSIETRYAEVADAALSGGFDVVNDVCGFADPAMPDVCREHDAAVVKMASPPDLERPGALADVDAIYDALAQNGFTAKTILDPAFGGWSPEKTTDVDRETFRRLREFRAYGRPLLVSINRKNFLREIPGRSTEDALPASLAATAMAVERGAHVIRTHDVAETRDAALVGRAFARERVRTPTVEELDVTTVREAERHLDRLADATGARMGGGTADGDGPRHPVARGAVSRAFAVRGLDRGDRRALREAAAAAGVVASDADPVFLAGTVAALETLERRMAGGSRGLGEDLDAIWSALE